MAASVQDGFARSPAIDLERTYLRAQDDASMIAEDLPDFPATPEACDLIGMLADQVLPVSSMVSLLIRSERASPANRYCFVLLCVEFVWKIVGFVFDFGFVGLDCKHRFNIITLFRLMMALSPHARVCFSPGL